MTQTGKDKRAIWLRALVFVGLVGFIVIAGFLFVSMVGGGFDFSVKALADYVVSLGPWGHAAVIGLMVVHSFVPFPAEVVALAAGMCYGPILGAGLVWVGAMFGASLSFGLSRAFGRPFIEMLVAGRHYNKLEKLANQQGTHALLVSRFIPLIAFNLINYAAGLTRVSWTVFLWTTALGILPLTILMTLMGDQMRQPDWGDWGLFALAGFVLLALVLVVEQRRRRG